jgi:ribosomal protein L35AE/L33A
LFSRGENRKRMVKINGFHGKKGVIRVKFKKSLPGQALGTLAELIS